MEVGRCVCVCVHVCVCTLLKLEEQSYSQKREEVSFRMFKYSVKAV